MSEETKEKQNLILEALKSQKLSEKILAVRALGILKSKKHTDLLIDLLGTHNTALTPYLLTSLAAINSPKSVKYIASYACNPDESISEAAFAALESMNLAENITELKKLASPEQPVYIRKRTLEILMSYPSKEVSSFFASLLPKASAPEIVMLCLDYFIENPQSELLMTLKGISSSPNWQIAMRAELALSRIKDEGGMLQVKRLAKSSNPDVRNRISEALPKYLLIEDCETVLVLLRDTLPKVRLNAANCLGIFREEERISLLNRLLLEETDNQVLAKFLEEAAKIGSSELFTAVFHHVNSQDATVKKLAAKALVKMGSEAAEKIKGVFGTLSSRMKEAVQEVLAEINSEISERLLIDSLASNERWLRISAILSLGKHDKKELYEKIAETLREEKNDIWIMATAAAVLGRSGLTEYAQDIRPLLKHPDGRVRANTLEALSKLDDFQETELLEYLEDKNDRVRVNAALALKKLGSKDVLPKLRKMTESPSKWVRSSAVFALARFKNEEKKEILLKLLKDKENSVYLNALKELAKTGEPEVLFPLMREAETGRLGKDAYDEVLKLFESAFSGRNLTETPLRD